MDFTQTSHFVGDINLPTSSPSFPYEGVQLLVEMPYYESIFLSQLLGYKMTKDLQTAYAGTPPTSGIWYDLAQGKEFTDSLGRLNKWMGFVTIGYNPIANFIYCKIQEKRQTQTTGIGEQKPNVSGNQAVSANTKIVRAWNDMVDWNNILYDFLTINKALYPDYIGVDNTNIGLYTKENLFGI